MSSALTVALRRLVRDRARGICEYCLIRENDSAFDFQVEHIISEKHGGASVAENLALACIFGNRYKGSDVASVSPTSGNVARLYRPRESMERAFCHQWLSHRPRH